MANTLDVKRVVKHLANGTLAENLCLICLAPLNELCENIFTKVCKEDKEYCIADVLETVCQLKFTEELDNYNVCFNCFITASVAYKFYLLSKRTQEILNFYTEQLNYNIDNIFLPEDILSKTLCISLPMAKPEASNFDYDLDSVGLDNYVTSDNNEMHIQKPVDIKKDDKFVVVIKENEETLFFKVLENGNMILLEDYERNKCKEVWSNATEVKKCKGTRRRTPMRYKSCSRCPVKYRFAGKLRNHMKMEHNVELYVCKICSATTEDEPEYHTHLKTHTNVHQCALCGTVFKKRDTIIAHLKWHEKMKNLGQSGTGHICEICGVILDSEEGLSQHWETRHCKKYTCYYCGRMYKGETSFEMHIKKHEQYVDKGEKPEPKPTNSETKRRKLDKSKPRCTCTTCGRNFVDQRSLMWHQRLHNNEKPYVCAVCGRGFVSLNRRNQHWQCAHTAPARRCPLCPALFHLRSMVNTHIKKVHLKTHKRRNRTSKYQNVYWRTKPVPIQELSVSIQNEILEMQAARDIKQEWITESGVKMEDN